MIFIFFHFFCSAPTKFRSLTRNGTGKLAKTPLNGLISFLSQRLRQFNHRDSSGDNEQLFIPDQHRVIG
jgi:hypothetical protein